MNTEQMMEDTLLDKAIPNKPEAKKHQDTAAVKAATSPPDYIDVPSDVIDQIKHRMGQDVSRHDGWADPVMFNGGTILVLVLTMLATFLPSNHFPWGPLCAGLAGLFVAMERALGFGARWRFHREMRSAYQAIIDMLEFIPFLPSSERPNYVRDIFAALYGVRSRESAIPNAGTIAAPT